MKIIFGTTNKRKVKDLLKVINELNLDIEILSLDDIKWNLGEIEENGKTIEENSLIKAQSIYKFCKNNNINYPIITDDSGLFVECLNGEPGIYTARYAEKELALDNTLPKYYGVIKLLNKMNNMQNRKAIYRCCVTCMLSNGTYFQEIEESEGTITKQIISELKKPYFYSIFVVNDFSKVFNDLSDDEIKDTFRFKALRKTLTKI